MAASSAVPILFQPVLLKRYDDCFSEKPAWLNHAEERAVQEDDPRLKASVEALNFYLDKDNPPYVTLLDGGITDNLGLRSILTSVNISGGAQKVYDRNYQKQKPPKQLVVIVVNASTISDTHIGENELMPSIGDTLSAVTDIQLHLYNTETNILLKEQLMLWAKKVSTDENPITPYFIDLNVTGIENKKDKVFFNQIPTNFSLEENEADKLIELARELLRNNPEYKKLLRHLGVTNSKKQALLYFDYLHKRQQQTSSLRHFKNIINFLRIKSIKIIAALFLSS